MEVSQLNGKRTGVLIRIFVMTAASLSTMFAAVNGDLAIYRSSCESGGLFQIGKVNQQVMASLMSARNTSSEIECITLCLQVEGCDIVNIKKRGETEFDCQLLSAQRPYSITSSSSWHYFVSSGSYMANKQRLLPCHEDSACRIAEKLKAVIYIPFDKVHCKSIVFYTFGKDGKGNRTTELLSARVERDASLGRDVVVKVDQKPIKIGDFNGHPINDPINAAVTLSIWIKCDSKLSRGEYINYMYSGKSDEPGLYVGHRRFGQNIEVYAVSGRGNWYFTLNYDSNRICSEWLHLAITFSDKDSELRFYVNGTQVSVSTKKNNLSKYSEFSTLLEMGQVAKFCQFGYWDRVLSPNEIQMLYNSIISPSTFFVSL